MIVLRDYQNDMITDVRAEWSKGKKAVVVQGPTGCGKTVIFSYMAQQAAAKGKTVLIVTDRTELLSQTSGTLNDFGLRTYNIIAGTKILNKDKDVFVGMTQTLRNRLKTTFWRNWLLREVDLIIIDEAHIQNSNHFFEEGLLKGKFVLGFTATPKRTGTMRQLGIDYESLVIGPTVNKLIEDGFLVSDEYYGVQGADLSNLAYSAMKGDFAEADMFERFNTKKLYSGVVKNWVKVANGTKTIVFCVNIEHVIHTVEEFQKNGIDARFVTSSMGEPKQPLATPDEEPGKWEAYREKKRLYDLYIESFGHWSGERSRIIKGFKSGEFPVLVNAGIATTGFDVPDIQTVIINRATLSLALWLQMIGRGSRIFPEKFSFNILDFGENANRLGHYTAPQNWGLWHESSKGGEGVPPMKECGIGTNGKPIRKDAKGCERLILAAYKICPFCGFKYPKKKAVEIELDPAVFDGHVSKPLKKVEEMTNAEIKHYAKVKKFKPGWLWWRLYFNGGEDRIREFAKENHWRPNTLAAALNFTKKFK